MNGGCDGRHPSFLGIMGCYVHVHPVMLPSLVFAFTPMPLESCPGARQAIFVACLFSVSLRRMLYG